MKIKIMILSTALLLASSMTADARGGITIDAIFGAPQPAYYEEPAPAYVIAPSYDRYNGHRHYATRRHDDRRDDHRR